MYVKRGERGSAGGGAGVGGAWCRGEIAKMSDRADLNIPPPLKAKVTSGPGRPTQNRYTAQTLLLSELLKLVSLLFPNFETNVKAIKYGKQYLQYQVQWFDCT